MVTISFTFADELAPRIIAAFCGAYGYQPTVEGKSNPETPAEFARRKVADYVREVVAGYEVTAAREAAAKEATTAVAKEVSAAEVTITATQE